MKWNLVCLILYLGTNNALAQVLFTSKVDSLNMLIGDQQSLEFTVTSPAGINPADIHTEFVDTCSFLEIINQSTWTRTEENQKTIQLKTIRFGIFDEGHFVIPACYTLVGNDTLWTYPIPIDVRGIEPDSTGLMPIKGIIREKTSWTDYMIYILGTLAVILVYILYRLYKKQQAKKVKSTELPPPVKLLPHEIALQKLTVLKQNRLWEQGEVKEFHVQLTYILREYLENRFLIPALESTTVEIERDVKRLGLSQDQNVQIHNLLHVADWVKFARGNPEENANSLAIDQAITLVQQTQPQIVSPLTNEIKS